VVKLTAITPLWLAATACVLAYRSPRRHPVVLLSLLWLLLVMTLMTIISVKGAGFQMRYVSAAVPAIYILAAGCTLLDHRGKQVATLLTAILIAYSAVTYGSYIWRPQKEEITSVSEYVESRRDPSRR